ncbi:hypothetical protein MUG87_08935 [Ectobacillus sp. JY-23]|uniref:hypothetical protein n=1 Tax=Ectobacillus sp. JY-23 TaxID=2933872 RepID=UPI001FF125A4|nr:hypothetical protein [Ectobacillus sp. JY-23]UOY94199.1 hypothetical protein MUG87_08935 [Ectobacillus sp. JY-23]
MLKRHPSKMILEGEELLIPKVQCKFHANYISLSSTSRKINFNIICPIPSVNLESEEYLDIYLNKLPDFFRGEKVYYYEGYSFSSTNFSLLNKNFTVTRGSVEIDYLSIRTFSVDLELTLQDSAGKEYECKLFLYPLVDKVTAYSDYISYPNIVAPKVIYCDTKKEKNISNSKPIEELSLDDFTSSIIWEWDLENEHLIGQDETWVKPSLFKNIFEMNGEEGFVKGKIWFDRTRYYQCIFNIAVNTQANQIIIFDGAVYVEEHYISLEDFIKTFIKKQESIIGFELQESLYQKKLSVRDVGAPIELTF